MADERTLIDANQEHTIAGVTYDASEDIMNVTLNPVDKRLRVDAAISDVGDGATETTLQSILSALGGSSQMTTYVSTALTLTTGNTAYKCPASEQASRELLVISNTSNYDVYIGSSTVTTATGILLIPGATMSIASTSGVYAVSATDGVIVRIMEAK
jgi:hypothetical protein